MFLLHYLEPSRRGHHFRSACHSSVFCSIIFNHLLSASGQPELSSAVIGRVEEWAGPASVHHTRTRAATRLLARSLCPSPSFSLPLSPYLSYIRQCSDCSRTQDLKDFPPHTETETLETSTPRSRGVPNPDHSKREGECVYLVAVYDCVCVCSSM